MAADGILEDLQPAGEEMVGALDEDQAAGPAFRVGERGRPPPGRQMASASPWTKRMGRRRPARKP